VKKVFAVLLVLVLFCGCGTFSKSHDYADYSMSLTHDISFYSQYEIIYKAKTKKGYKLVVAPFLADSNNYLPEKIIKLHFGLKVFNPNREKFVVWMDFQFVEVDGELFQRTSKLVYKSQALPEEFINIDLPYITNIHSEISLSISVIGGEGKVLYQSTEALYKVRGVKK
jgi:hypothetical protein